MKKSKLVKLSVSELLSYLNIFNNLQLEMQKFSEDIRRMDHEGYFGSGGVSFLSSGMDGIKKKSKLLFGYSLLIRKELDRRIREDLGVSTLPSDIDILLNELQGKAQAKMEEVAKDKRDKGGVNNVSSDLPYMKVISDDISKDISSRKTKVKKMKAKVGSKYPKR